MSNIRLFAYYLTITLIISLFLTYEKVTDKKYKKKKSLKNILLEFLKILSVCVFIITILACGLYLVGSNLPDI